VETCGECGYCYGALRREDIATELRTRALSYVGFLTAFDVQRLREHPRPGVWSALEYACHVRDVHMVQGARILQACHEDRPDFASMRREERVLEQGYNEQDRDVVAAQIRGSADTLARTLDRLDHAGWARTGIYHWPTTEVRTVDWIARHTVHESVHHFRDITQILVDTP